MTTSLLLHMDGGNGAGAPTLDATGKTITVVGTALLSTAQSKFGGASLALNGTSQYVTAADCPDFNFGDGDFCVEAWVYTTSLAAAQTVLCKGTNAAFGPFRIGVAATTGIVTGYTSTNGSSWTQSVAGAAITINTWNHVALVRNGTVIQMYVNGVAAVSPGAISTTALTTNATAASFGATSDAAQYLAGYIDEVRITKGQAIYTAAFTPPTSPFAIAGDDPYWDKVVLAMHMDGANGGTTFTDIKGKTVTPTATTTSTAQSKFGGASAVFNGTSSQLSVPHSADLNFGAGDFCIDFWIKPTTTYNSGAAQKAFVCKWGISGLSNLEWLVAYATGSIRLVVCDGVATPVISVVKDLTAGVWYHIAASRSGSAGRIFVDGVMTEDPSFFSGMTLQSTTLVPTIGSKSGANFADCHIDDLRITKGVARYTADFTPPTDAFAVVGGDPLYDKVVLALHMDGANAGTAFPCAAGKVVTAVSTTTSTAQSKFGGASASFNGTSSYLSIPSSTDFDFGPGDFCIEGHMRFTALPTSGATMVFAAKYASSGNQRAWLWYIDNTGGTYTLKLLVSPDGTSGAAVTVSSSTITPSTGVWYHYVVVRDAGVVTFYVNGVGVGGAANTTNIFAGSANVTVGVDSNLAGAWFNGYIDDLRITKGAARY